MVTLVRRMAGVLLVGGLPALPGCRGDEARELEAYRTVAGAISDEVRESMTLNLGKEGSACFSSCFFPHGQTKLPNDLLAALKEDGWTLYDSSLPTDEHSRLRTSLGLGDQPGPLFEEEPIL